MRLVVCPEGEEEGEIEDEKDGLSNVGFVAGVVGMWDVIEDEVRDDSDNEGNDRVADELSDGASDDQVSCK